MKSVTVRLAALAAVTAFLGCEFETEPPASKTNDEIVGGNAVANPPGTGHVFLTRKNPAQATFTLGSGTLVRPNWALVSAHVLEQSNCPVAANSTGNTALTCSFLPDTHEVTLGNANASNTKQKAAQVFVPPGYAPKGGLNTDNGDDVALIRLQNSFGTNANFTKNLVGGAAQSHLGKTATLFGYGCTILGGCPLQFPPTLFSLDFKFASIDGNGLYNSAFSSGTSTGPGDSGGPYMLSGLIAAVHAGRELSTNVARSVPAERFKSWFDTMLDPNMVLTANYHADTDLKPDAFFLMRNQTFTGLPGTYWAFKILFANGNELRVLLIPDNGAITLNSSAFAIGDFNGDSIKEAVFHLNNVGYYFQPPTISNPLGWVQQTGFALASGADYAGFRVDDFDNDGVDDLEATDSSGFVDIYFGKALSDPEPEQGLQPGTTTYAFPSLAGGDGKFASVSGMGSATVNFPKLTLLIDVEPGSKEFNVHVFDGDLGGTNDRVGGETCLTLHADKNNDLVSDEQIIQLPSSAFADHAWSNLYDGAVHENAKTPGGYYYYFLDIEQVEGTCTNPSTNTLPSINAFAVRSTGVVGMLQGQYSFIGRDLFGDFVPTGDLEGIIVRDTKYDGVWKFYSGIGAANQAGMMGFQDADADELDDASEPAGTWGSADVHAPGVAVGANSAIRYEVRNGAAALVIDALNPSGNNDPLGALQDVEFRSVAITQPTKCTSNAQCEFGNTCDTSTGNCLDLWEWTWFDVLSENNVQISVPFAIAPPSPASRTTASSSPSAVQTALFTRPSQAVFHAFFGWSTADTVTTWLNNPAMIQPLLPIVLGDSKAGLVVGDLQTALEILRKEFTAVGGSNTKKVSVCHKGKNVLTIGSPALPAHLAHGDTTAPTRAAADMAAELLAAKLNVGRAGPNEDLLAARVYGTTSTVFEALALGDSLLDLDSACKSIEFTTAVLRARNLLFATNRREVTNIQPTTVQSASAAKSKTSSPSYGPNYPFTGQ